MNNVHPLSCRIIGLFAAVALFGCGSKDEGFETPLASESAEELLQAVEIPAIELYALDCGYMEWSDLGVFSDEGAYDGQSGRLVDPCYLVRHPQGDLLWDLGLPESIADSPEGMAAPNLPVHIYVPRKLSDQLAELELGAADIDFISVSHSHFDHIGNGNLFAENSTWIVDVDERDFAFRDELREDPRFAAYSALENADTILIEGDNEYDVFQDGSVLIVQAPGHTPGHAVLLVNLTESGPVILSGDLWHIAESRPNRRVPVFNTDREQTLASMEMVEALAEETGARVILQHVQVEFEAMPAFPNAME